MSRSDDTIADNREQIGTKNRDVLGMIRRMRIGVTGKTFWQAVGLLLLDGVTRETLPVEVFPGIGFFARPAVGANAECIVAHAGGRSNPAIVATRDEGTRRKMAAIDNDETAMFNTLVGVYATKGGKIEARTAAGPAVELAKASELNDLRAFVADQFSAIGHSHASPAGPTTSTVAIGTVPTTDYPGTEVLKGE